MEHNVVFIPWLDGEGPRRDLTLNAEQWRAGSTAKVYTLIYPDDPFPLHIPKKVESIYIMGGHCEPKLDHVYWSPPKEKKYQLFPEEYVKRFTALFPDSIDCRVAVYSCYSAAGEEEAFGRRVAALLRKAGYKKCPLWGYTEAVSQEYWGGKGSLGPSSKPLSSVAKKTFPADISEEHPHRYSKKGKFGTWKRVSDSLQALDEEVPLSPPPKFDEQQE
jgi:hypothetical protein